MLSRLCLLCQIENYKRKPKTDYSQNNNVTETKTFHRVVSKAKTFSTVLSNVHDCSGLYPVHSLQSDEGGKGREREGKRDREKEQVRAIITSWGFTGDTHIHTDSQTHSHTPYRVDFSIEKCADLH